MLFSLLQTDAYAAFDAIAQRAPNKSSATDRARRVLCLGHARRHFHDLHAAVGSPVAVEALQRIGELYHIECEIKGCTPQERFRVRQVQAVPRLRALHAWLSNTLSKTSGSSALVSEPANKYCRGRGPLGGFDVQPPGYQSLRDHLRSSK